MCRSIVCYDANRTVTDNGLVGSHPIASTTIAPAHGIAGT